MTLAIKKNFIKTSVTTLITLVVASCATVSKDASINTTALDSSNEAVLILAVPAVNQRVEFAFRRIKDDYTDFTGDIIKVRFGFAGGLLSTLEPSDLLKQPKGMRSNLWVIDPRAIRYTLKTIPVGKYVATSTFSAAYNAVNTFTIDTCLEASSVVFEVRPNNINIISSNDVLPPSTIGRLPKKIPTDQLIDVFEETRKNYKGIVGKAKYVEPLTLVRWKQAPPKNLFSSMTDTCASVEAGTMQQLSGIGTGNQKIDEELEKSVLKEAMENISKRSKQAPMEKSD